MHCRWWFGAQSFLPCKRRVFRSAEIIGIDNINNSSTWTNVCKTRLRVPAALNDNLTNSEVHYRKLKVSHEEKGEEKSLNQLYV